MNKNIIPISIYNGDNMNYIIIKNGKVNFKNLIKNKMDINKLFYELYLRKIKNIEGIKLLLVFKKLYIFKISKEPISLIIDGKYVYSNFFNNDINFFWLKKILKKYRININMIKYAVYIKNKLFIIRYNN